MEIREAQDSDASDIVDLLKVSLGESLMPKSEVFWRWKHIENPFGKSPVLLAFDSGKLVGVRAFMRWEWRQGEKVFKAVRAVDTATHPDFQGKGIFKKLTLQLVEKSRHEGVDFIFNTPNKSSKPGYLKMGWYEQGRMGISLRPVFSLRKNGSSTESKYLIDGPSMQHWLMQDDIFRDSESLVTNGTSSFYRWRYLDNPNISYRSFSDVKRTFMVLFRLKSGRFGTEFRICDLLHTRQFDVRAFPSELLRVARELGATYITWSGRFIKLSALNLKMGPVVTVHPLSSDNSLSFDFWRPTLGDMEVF
jgi:GNAT superfamily N-acetyltransferase